MAAEKEKPYDPQRKIDRLADGTVAPESFTDYGLFTILFKKHTIVQRWNSVYDETRWICNDPACDFETDDWHGASEYNIAAHHTRVIEEYLLDKEK